MRRAGDQLSVRQYGTSTGSHVHEHFQVLLGLRGELELDVQGRGRRIGIGEGCVIAPGERHDFESLRGANCLVLDTSGAAWADCEHEPQHPEMALALALYLNLTSGHGQLLANRLGPSLLLDCWRPAKLERMRCQRAIDWHGMTRWAEQHLHQSLQAADLALRACLSPTQFAKRCRDETGMSPMHWLRTLRLAKARELRARGLSVADTALRCGYLSPSALTAALGR